MEIHEITKHATKHIAFRSNPEIERKVNCFLAAGVDKADANILKSDLQRHALSTFVVQWQKAIIENENILKSDPQRHALSTFVVQRQKAIIENAECKYIEI